MSIFKGKGNIWSASVIFIGEAPGKEELKQNEIFVGPSGKVLNEWITFLGLKDEEVYITNAVKELPSHRKTPNKGDIWRWQHALRKEVLRIQPKVIITLGLTAIKSISDFKVTKLSGAINTANTVLASNFNCLCVPFYHPAYAIRQGVSPKELQEELLKLKNFLTIYK